MDAVAARVEIRRPVAPEDAARGNFYALFARLLAAAPDAALLQTLSGAEPIDAQGDPALARAWQELITASSVMDADAAAEEYEALFVGVGKAAVSLYAGYYTGALAIDHPRVRLQADLAAFGLAAREHSTEPEDHFGALFDVMRLLVAGGAQRGPAPLEEQKRFFESYLATGAPKFFSAVMKAGAANYYRRIAALGQAFMAIEIESLALD